MIRNNPALKIGFKQKLVLRAHLPATSLIFFYFSLFGTKIPPTFLLRPSSIVVSWNYPKMWWIFLPCGCLRMRNPYSSLQLIYLDHIPSDRGEHKEWLNPPGNIDSSHLKMDGWERILSFWEGLFTRPSCWFQGMTESSKATQTTAGFWQLVVS